MKHGGGSVMAWACMVASGVGSFIFIDDVINDGCSKMNSEVYKNIMSANLQKHVSKLIGRHFIKTQPKTRVHHNKRLH